MNLVFRDQIDNELGRIEHQNIHEIIIPAFKEDAHDMFIKRVFQGHPEVNTWQILEMVTDNLDVYLKLRPITSVMSYKEFTKSQNRKAEQIFKKFSIVEVDFGFYSDIFNHQGQKLSHDRHTHTVLKGELHKRRPCLVLKVKRNILQVIPLSTGMENQHDPKCVRLENLPSQLADKYHQKPSFALLNMMQTVSSARVYPPQYKNTRPAHSVYKLNALEQKQIDLALASIYSKDVIQHNERLSLQLESVQHERKKLLDKYRTLKAKTTHLEQDVSSLSQYNDKLKAYLEQIEAEWGLGISLNKVL